MKNFADRLLEAIDKVQNPSVIGLDSDLSRIPASFKKVGSSGKSGSFASVSLSMLEFNKDIIDNIKDIVPAVKIQSAFYEQYGPDGIKTFIESAKYAKSKGLIVIGDVKRSDIGNTTKAYSNAYLGRVPTQDSSEPAFDLDCITVNPYLGSDSVKPFMDDCKSFGKGLFVLVKTSNPSSGELQDLVSGGRKLHESVAGLVNEWGKGLMGERGFSSVGAVVGATHPNEAAGLRKIMPKLIFLVPGFGAQGGGASDVVPCFNSDGYGALVNSSRGVIFAGEKNGKDEGYGEAAKEAAISMSDEIRKALKGAHSYPW